MILTRSEHTKPRYGVPTTIVQHLENKGESGRASCLFLDDVVVFFGEYPSWVMRWASREYQQARPWGKMDGSIRPENSLGLFNKHSGS